DHPGHMDLKRGPRILIGGIVGPHFQGACWLRPPQTRQEEQQHGSCRPKDHPPRKSEKRTRPPDYSLSLRRKIEGVWYRGLSSLTIRCGAQLWRLKHRAPC